jgi:hypothetical protein
MSIQAPITRVINLIMAAQENSPNDVALALDKVSIPNIVACFWRFK